MEQEVEEGEGVEVGYNNGDSGGDGGTCRVGQSDDWDGGHWGMCDQLYGWQVGREHKSSDAERYYSGAVCCSGVFCSFDFVSNEWNSMN
jgi:hypothetical protein